jgi:capsular polysaccharide biosynthesis protein
MRPHRLGGRAGLLTTNFGRGYFHWLVDVLPRAEALRTCGVDPQTLDHVIVPSLIAPFQTETLQAVGLNRKQLVSSLRHRHLVADELLVPSLVRPAGPIPRWACEFLRSTIKPSPPREQGLPERLLITRKATDHGFSGLHEVLNRWGRRHGFAPVALEDFTMAQKAWILARTRVLIGESGAGLTNIVFSHPGARLIEITNLPVPDPVFWDLASQCGHDYRSVRASQDAALIERELDEALSGLGSP